MRKNPPGKKAYESANKDATTKILKYGLSFRRSAIFMIKQKYPELDLFDIVISFMHGYNVPDLADKSELIKNLNVEGSEIVVDQLEENGASIEEKSIENANLAHLINDESFQENDNVINVLSD